MKILIDIGHPAHVHLFKNFARDMISMGHEILFTCREKEFEIELLEVYKFNFISFGKKYTSVLGKIWGLVEFDLRMVIAGIKFKPDILLSAGSMYLAHASIFLRKPHISFEDTGNMEQVRLYLPFTDVILSPKGFQEKYGENHLFYDGFHQLAHLHKYYFANNIDVESELNISSGDNIIFIRFVAYNASHDIGYKSLSENDKVELINSLPVSHKILISSEGKLPSQLEKYSVKFPPEKIHSVLSQCKLYVGQSSTMAIEAATLGVKAIFIQSLNESTVGILDYFDQTSFIHISRFGENQLRDLSCKILEILAKSEEKKVMESEFLNVTEYLKWFVLNYPQSFDYCKKLNKIFDQKDLSYVLSKQ